MRLIQLEHLDSALAISTINEALVFEGLDMSEDNLNKMFDWLEEYTKVDLHVVYYVKGFEMNEWYGLTGTNAYPSDLNIVMLSLDDMKDPSKIVLRRFDVGGRWLSDVIDNNNYRQTKMDSDEQEEFYF